MMPLGKSSCAIFGKLIERNMVKVIAAILSVLIKCCPSKCSTHLDPVPDTALSLLVLL